jgi:hypothetical protein
MIIQKSLGGQDSQAACRRAESGGAERDSAEVDISLATLHVRDRSSDGPELTYRALHKLSRLASVRARQVRLPPLIAELEKRKTKEYADLARSVRLI